MKHARRWILALAVLATTVLAGLAFAPAPVDAGMICNDGRWIATDEHCQLGTLVNCTECWVWPK